MSLQRIPNNITDISAISPYTKLLITGTGENNSTSIVDMLGKTVTRYGDTKISTAQSIIGGSSIYFDGTGDYLTLADSDDWNFGSGDFTIDLWAYYPTGGSIAISTELANTYSGFIMYMGTTGGDSIYCSSNNSSWDITSGNKAIGTVANSWHHVAIIRTGTNFIIFKNGSVVQQWTSSASLANNSSVFSIGRTQNVNYANGYISHLRITKGQALWTSNFTPPTSISDYSTPIYQSNANYITRTGTKLLITGNGENNSTTITDATGKTVTRYGDTKIFTAQSIIGGSSIYFDGTGDYLSLADSEDWNFGSGDFTIDCWAYLSSTSYGTIIAVWDASTDNSFEIIVNMNLSQVGTANRIFCRVSDGSSFVFCGSDSSVLVSSSWNHIALVRYGNVLSCYVNGAKTTDGNVTFSLKNGTKILTIGRINYDTIPYYFNGYLSHIRITKGKALWTSNFTPPATAGDYLIPQYSKYKSNSVELINISNRNRIGAVPDYAVTANTKLLITGAGENNSTTITDTTGKTVTRSGDTKISTAQSIIGGSSIYFDGTGDYLSIPYNTDFDFGSGDFTVDFYCRFNQINADNFMLSVNDMAGGIQGWGQAVFEAGPTKFMFMFYTTSNNEIAVLTTVAINTWYHLAMVRNGTSFFVFVNGILSGTATTSASLANTNNGIIVGGRGFTGPITLHNGYLSHIRITKGQALWTSNFTPPKIINNNYIGA